MRVNNEQNRFDREVIELIKRGFHGKTIAKRTGLTIGQVRYRSTQAKVSALDYRDGRGTAAQSELNDVRQQLDRIQFLNRTVNDVKRKP